MGNAKHVRDWRRRTKEKATKAFGGRCCICGYDKCHAALEFHHLEAKEKGIGAMLTNPSSWERIVKELRKCVCICSNCHKEVHAGVTSIPPTAMRFDESYAEKKKNPR